ncbi:xaa-Arg dipeptidase [Nematostella vectensis]|uniref:xaa-Arg dipeptidase n=1 Tax=Nematostella vectensis TaxID=45351 RepID=UPI0013900EA4|nr:xaa-Arg dipeptidase [Nematostella vectensis]
MAGTDTTMLKKIACEAIDENAAELRDLNRKIWENPELSCNEKFAHKVLTDFLEEKGFDVTRSWALETAFVARSGNGDDGPCVGVICEYDALPEVGHACGHNLIAAAGAAAGIGIKAAIDSLSGCKGKISVLGTPAEEHGNGKGTMIRNGCFESIDFCMMVHPFPSNTTMPTVLADKVVMATFKGQTTHAAAFPWEGVNALDAAIMAYSNLSMLRQQLRPSWRFHSIITEGGVKPNIIPDQTKMIVEYRAPTENELKQLEDKCIRCLEGAAMATGCTLEMEFLGEPHYSNLATNERMASLYQANAETIGEEFPPLDEQKAVVLGSTDMGNVSHVVPSIHPLYSIGTASVNHSHAFREAAGQDISHEKSLLAAKAMAMTAIDLLCNKGLMDEVRREFEKTHAEE